jgi:HD-GYP domain-containing protein (c-di-GMP phosphodiesterase class II)
MREHVNTGARILEPIPGFAELIPIVLQHHERFDGSGYPQGLAGEEISIHGRIFAVADVYDALISDRPYRPGWPTERVIAFMQEQAGSHFDPRVVQAFLEVMKRENSLAAREKREGTGGAEKDKTAQPIAALRRTQCAGS